MFSWKSSSWSLYTVYMCSRVKWMVVGGLSWVDTDKKCSLYLGECSNWLLVCDLNRTPIVMAKHGGSCVHFSGISTCGRTSRETVSHSQRPSSATLYKISLPIYVIVTNKMLQPLTTAWYNSLVLSFLLLKIQRHLIKHRSFLHVRAVEGSALSFADGAAEVLHVQVQILYCLLYKVMRASSEVLIYEIKCNTHTHMKT